MGPVENRVRARALSLSAFLCTPEWMNDMKTTIKVSKSVCRKQSRYYLTGPMNLFFGRLQRQDEILLAIDAIAIGHFRIE